LKWRDKRGDRTLESRLFCHCRYRLSAQV